MRAFAFPAVLMLLAGCSRALGWDEMVAGWFYDTHSTSFPLRHAWWAEHLLHRGGADFIALLAGSALLTLLASLRSARLRPLRGDLAYLLACMLLTTGSVALIKRHSGVDCPWNQPRYGAAAGAGDGRCFPGGHSSGAFSLLALYCIAGRRRPAAAPAVLGAVSALGLVYASTQWLRGAHLPSHDLVSAAIGASVALGLDALRRPAQPPDRGRQGRSSTTRAPEWLSSITQSPSCSSATARTSDRPRPLPGVLRLVSRRYMR